MSDKSCDKCSHFNVCGIVKRFRGTIKRNGRNWIPIEGQSNGIRSAIYGCVALACCHFKSEVSSGRLASPEYKDHLNITIKEIGR